MLSAILRRSKLKAIEEVRGNRKISSYLILYTNNIENMQEKPSLHVLVVEDHPINQELMQEMLSGRADSVDLAENGEEALSFLKEKDYDIIFMDLQMPIMDGLETTRRIRELEEPKKHTLIVALTASVMKEDIKKCFEAGMDDYLGKPIELRDIEAMLRKHFG